MLPVAEAPNLLPHVHGPRRLPCWWVRHVDEPAPRQEPRWRKRVEHGRVRVVGGHAQDALRHIAHAAAVARKLWERTHAPAAAILCNKHTSSSETCRRESEQKGGRAHPQQWVGVEHPNCINALAHRRKVKAVVGHDLVHVHVVAADIVPHPHNRQQWWGQHARQLENLALYGCVSI